MSEGEEHVQTDVLVIGAGFSGVATAKCLQQSGFKVVVLEKSSDVGGRWTVKKKDGFMSFTHM